MAWNVKESEQSVNRQLVFRRKEMASQIVTTKKGSGQIFVLNRPDFEFRSNVGFGVSQYIPSLRHLIFQKRHCDVS